MAVRTYPVSLADFFDPVCKTIAHMNLSQSLATGDTHGGDTFPINFGPRLWGGTVVTKTYGRSKEAEAMGLIEVLQQEGATFFVTDAVFAAPQKDPTGSILGASTVTITAKPSNQELTLSGLPAAYVLTRGDKISFSYGTGRYALHRMVDTVTASGGGVATVQVAPFIRGDPVGSVVSLIKPKCLAIMVPGSYVPPQGRLNSQAALSFDWIQVKP